MLQPRSDLHLVTAWQEGDAQAGQQLFERNYNRLAAFFRSKVGEEYPDLVQRTFLALVEGRERLRNAEDFRRYLFSIAYNQLFRHLRGRYRSLTRESLSVRSIAGLGPSPATLASQRERGRMLLGALRSLPIELQVAFELYCWEGMTAQEISGVLGVPLGTAKTRLRQARLRLQEVLQRKRASSNPADRAGHALDTAVREVRADLGDTPSR